MKGFHHCWGSRQANGSKVRTGRQRPIVSVFGSPVDSSPFRLTIREDMGGKGEEAMETTPCVKEPSSLRDWSANQCLYLHNVALKGKWWSRLNGNRITSPSLTRNVEGEL